MPSLLLTIGIATLTGLLAGGTAAWWLVRSGHEAEAQATDTPDEWVSAEIDRAAVNWAMSQGCPEAAPLMADKLHLLHRLGRRQRRAAQ